MARLARAVAPGVPHHITQRGNRRQAVFFSDEDYALYRALLIEQCFAVGIKALGYCLMPNHVHLILVRPEALPLGMTYDQDFENAALPVAHKLGLTPAQLQGLLDFYAAHAGNTHHAATRAREQDEADSTAMQQKEWGKAYEAKSAQALDTARRFGGDVLINLLTSAGVKHRPEIMRAFASIAETAGDWVEGEQIRGHDTYSPSLDSCAECSIFVQPVVNDPSSWRASPASSFQASPTT